nr:hypothetical protein [uncultured Dysosmobacter sp.]
MTDITPGLYAEISADFTGAVANDTDLAAILAAIDAGQATHADTYHLAAIIGKHASSALQAHIATDSLPDGRLYFNIADGTVAPVLRQSHNLVTGAGQQVQRTLNQRARIGINPIIPALDENRLRDLLYKLGAAESFDDVAWLLGAPVQNFVESVADAMVRENVDFHARAGLAPKIRRVATPGCCEWCATLAGTYDYDKAPADVYRRHERCTCNVEYDPSDSTGLVQNVWSKRWHDPNAAALIDFRSTVGLRRRR